VEITYYRKSPCGLYYSGPVPLTEVLLRELHGQDDDQTPGIVMRHYGESGLVVDPCAGRGQTSREAERSGWQSVNNELNPLRVSAALSRMMRLLGPGNVPRRVA